MDFYFFFPEPTKEQTHTFSVYVSGHWQDSDGVWQQLPYEVAHGVAKTVTMHGADVAAAKKELVKLLETDTEENKTKTKKAREQTERLKNVERWMIFNRRTGQLAVPEWIQKHIQADEQGRPQPKNPKTTSRPWLMTLKIVMVDTANVEISLRTDQQENAPFRRVRCLSLSQGTEKATLAHLTQGYSHLVSGNDEDDAEDRLLLEIHLEITTLKFNIIPDKLSPQ